MFMKTYAVQELLHLKSLKNARLISGKSGINNTYSGIIVMEAPDINEWGRSGLIILSSFYALQNLTKTQISDFFHSAHNIGIAAIILKIDRLINKVPDFMMELSNQLAIPLIQVEKNVSYESISVEVMQNIVSRNSYLLNYFYDMHSFFVKKRLQQLSIEDILHTLSSFINQPVTLIEENNQTFYTTDDRYKNFDIKGGVTITNEQFINYELKQLTVEYENTQFTQHTKALAISIPTLGYETFVLYIHEVDQTITDENLVAIEIEVSNLQTELIQNYLIRNANRSEYNEMVSDLLQGRTTNQKDINEILAYLNMEENISYQVVLFKINKKQQNQESNSKQIVDNFIRHMKNSFSTITYATRKDGVTFIIPSESMEKEELTRLIENVLKNSVPERVGVQVSISHSVQIDRLSTAYKQVKDTLQIMRALNQEDTIQFYEDIGIYRYFLSHPKEELSQYIPDVLIQLKKNQPDLLKTLQQFTESNQNYTQTANQLFIHPKTVRYRVNLLKENYNISFNNASKMLDLSVGLQLIKLLDKDVEKS